MSASTRFARTFLATVLLGPAPLLMAQEFAHPTELPMQAAADPRPAPAEHRVLLGANTVAYVVPDSTVPLVTVGALWGAGRTVGSAGAADAMAALWRKQSGQVFGELDAQVSVEVDAEQIALTIDLPAEQGARALNLLADILRKPALDTATVEQLLRPSVRPVRRSPEQATRWDASLDEAVRLFDDNLLAGSPYAPSLTEDAAGALDAAALEAFHRSLLAQAPLALTVAGDVSDEAARSWLSQEFPDGWRAEFSGEPLTRSTSPEPDSWPAGTGLLYPVDALQGWIVLGHPLPPVPEQDEAALLLMNYILGGGHFDARLFIEVRDKRGLANTAAAVPRYYDQGIGSYTFRSYGRPESIAVLRRILEDELRRMQREPASEEALMVAKGAYREGEYGMWYHNGAAAARSLGSEWLRFGDHRRSDAFRARIDAVSIEDIQRAAQRYLQPEALRLLVLGPIDEIQSATPVEAAPPLSAFGTLTVVQ
jgi:zinc protease